MDTCRSRECCGGQWAKRSVSTRFQSPTLRSPTSPVLAPWSRELPSFDDTPVLSDKKVGPPVPLLGDPVMSGKKIIQPVQLLRDPVISAKKTKIVPPVRLSGGRNYVDAS